MIRNIAIGTLVAILAIAVLFGLIIPAFSGGISLPFGNDGTPEMSNLVVGGSTQPACQAQQNIQIEPLRENGQVVPNAFMGLDLNSDEVGRGLRYNVSVPADTYVQYFEAWTGTTWEAVGPTTVVATAWTSWCNNHNWLANQGFVRQAGNHRQLNANSLPNPIGTWINK